MPLTLRAVLLAALLSGVLGGLVFFAAQSVTTRPLIVQAEVLEHAALHAAGTPHDHGAPHHDAPHHDAPDWEPAEGAERTAYTLGADILLGVGFAFLLVGAISLAGHTVTPASGLAWGAAGFLAFAAAPALGLPPEPPGLEGADLLLRQAWWLGTACATAAGLWLLVAPPRPWLRLAGVALLLAPHLAGAPQPPAVPAGEAAVLARSFLWASLAATAALWATLGVAAGWLLGRPQRLAGWAGRA